MRDSRDGLAHHHLVNYVNVKSGDGGSRQGRAREEVSYFEKIMIVSIFIILGSFAEPKMSRGLQNVGGYKFC